MDAVTHPPPGGVKPIEDTSLFAYTLPEWLKTKLGPLLDKAKAKETFFTRVGEIWPKTSRAYRMIERAYNAMEQAFRGKKRDNGEPYFEHLRASALIALVHMRVRDEDIICAILLHDALEDCPETWTYDRIVAEFNPNIAELVWHVTKPEPAEGESSEDVDRRYHRRLQNAPREAICVKLPERLHNMITIWGQNRDRICRKLSETKDFILPLAEKFHILIHEMEDVIRGVEKRLAA